MEYLTNYINCLLDEWGKTLFTLLKPPSMRHVTKRVIHSAAPEHLHTYRVTSTVEQHVSRYSMMCYSNSPLFSNLIDSFLVLLLCCVYMHHLKASLGHIPNCSPWLKSRMSAYETGFSSMGCLSALWNIFPNCFTSDFLVSEKKKIQTIFFNSKNVQLLCGGCEAAKCHQHSCMFKYQGTRERPAVLAAFILRGKKGDSHHIFSLIWPLMFFSHFWKLSLTARLLIKSCDTWLIFA